MIEKLHCICCNKLIKISSPYTGHPLESPESHIWSKGAVNKFYCGYGSRFDDNTYLIAICDDCIEDRFDKGVIVDVTDRD